ncbi:MAG: winged helix-turn-helix domain-containing protein [Acidobacteria bacterium]|nr:winged helix-turn-helix domain-containing protein [Acidobacteriota bacterium]
MASIAPKRRFYEFGSFRIDEENRLLYHREEVVPLQPKTFDILLALVESQGRVIEKEELMRRVWPDTFVEESNLSQNIYILRKLFGSDADGQNYIVTVTKRGYRFIADVSEPENESAGQAGVEGETRPEAESSSDSSNGRDVSVGAKKPASFIGGINRRRAALIVVAIAVAAGAGVYFYPKRAPALTERDTVLIADFANLTGDPVFDGTLKQGLAIQLEQSPFLNIFPDERVRETLRLMRRSADERVTMGVAREICERQGIKAVITGMVASLGAHYVITLEATNARSGDTLAREQVVVERKEESLLGLGKAATKLRGRLGESLASIEKFDAPIEQATTPSLEALKAFALGREQHSKGKILESIPFYKRAIEIDPDFASAYARLSLAYNNTSQQHLAIESAERAFKLRDRVSERERWEIVVDYHASRGEWDKVVGPAELWKKSYPKELRSFHMAGLAYGNLGQREKAIEEFRTALRIYPASIASRRSLSRTLVSLNRFEEARSVINEGLSLNPDFVDYRITLFSIAFAQGDEIAMRQQIEWARGKREEYQFLRSQAAFASFSGQFRQSRELYRKASEMARGNNAKEDAKYIIVESWMNEAVIGDCLEAKKAPSTLSGTLQPLSYQPSGIIALALCGETGKAQALADDLSRLYPTHIRLNTLWLPVIRAAVELRRGAAPLAIRTLQTVGPVEVIGGFWPNYLRGLAYLKQQAAVEAMNEFRTIIAHRGWGPASPLYPLAHLQLARAAALKGDTTTARKAYEDFFSLWKDADQDIPALEEARREYRILK